MSDIICTHPSDQTLRYQKIKITEAKRESKLRTTQKNYEKQSQHDTL